MNWNDGNIEKYYRFISALCEKESLRHMDRSAVSAVVEHSSRIAADQEKLSTRFSEIADLIREASYYASKDSAELVSKEHVDMALTERRYRSNVYQERFEEMVTRNVMLIDIEGVKIGQVNGLAVLSVGGYSFGRPSRVTASIGVGREGILDIEREAKLGGPLHTKGVLILGGYLTDMYAQNAPLSLTSRLVFEQSYGGIDGDSASSTELYAILSALSRIPIKQGIAVTGSVNQKGEVQAIGGVNEKIEGFFDVCKAKGLTGNQGVLIPYGNRGNLMLREDVVVAIDGGDFHVYPVKTIDEGIEILMGIMAGERRPDGSYEAGTINELVQRRLIEMADSFMEFSR
jgi:lon-related putative ATP-dependent protease